MATSPNFSWPEPDNTDLVKNGALAIRTAINAIDTSMVDLKGGTTGQVLAKASNTDMDFVWSADAAGMTNPMTTTGDTIYSSSGSTPARLGIGSSGQVLTVAGGIPSWATASGVGTWSSAASGSFTGTSVVISSLTGREFMIQVNGLSTGGDNTPLLRFNGDSGNNYGRQNIQDGFNDGMTVGRTGSAAAALVGMIYIPNASETTMWKYAIGGRNGEVFGGFYKGTSAITSITFDGNGGTFDSGTYVIWKRG